MDDDLEGKAGVEVGLLDGAGVGVGKDLAQLAVVSEGGHETC